MSTLPGFGIKDLDANVHPYVVFGNRGTPPLEFDPEANGMRPLSVMAVVCNGQLVRPLENPQEHFHCAEFEILGDTYFVLKINFDD